MKAKEKLKPPVRFFTVFRCFFSSFYTVRLLHFSLIFAGFQEHYVEISDLRDDLNGPGLH